MKFCVIRHDSLGIGTCPESALPLHQAAGWFRVSEFSGDPADFNLPDYAEAPDLDAPVIAPAATEKPASKTTKES
jgi:hypothetical protein